VKGKIILIGGGARSGKSDFALHLARQLGERRLFLATAQSGDKEMRERIECHRRTRGPDFDTREEPFAIAEVFRDNAKYDVIVLDCLTLWLSNLLCQDQTLEEVFQRLDELIAALIPRTAHAILVTNEVGLGIVPETVLGRRFRDLSGSAHRRLSDIADEVYFSVLGTMLRLKPTLAFVPLGAGGP
jgi:adenosylcobinamide kinase/adenosylcobinamide-phosphate guanylyltransferase